MTYEPLRSIPLQGGLNTSAAPLSPASQQALAASYNLIISGDGDVRPYSGQTSQGANSGSDIMLQFGSLYGGIKGMHYLDKTFSAPSAVGASNTITVANATDWVTGLPCTVSSTVTLPTGLAALTTYYIIVTGTNTLKFASTLANALLGTAVTITASTGSGTVTIDVANATVLASGNWMQDIGLSRWGIGSGQPLIAGVAVPGYTLSTNLQVQIPASGIYGVPVQAGLSQPSAPDIGIINTPGTISNPVSAKLERTRPSTGANSVASPNSAVINPQANRVRVTFPLAETGQEAWRVFFTFQGFGGVGVSYLAQYQSFTDIPESVVAAGATGNIGGIAATGSLSVGTNPTSAETIVVNGVTITFTTITGITLSGAGTSAANGTYTQRGTFNGKPYYNLVGQADSTTLYAVVWDSGAVVWRVLSSTGTNLYDTSADPAVDFPYLINPVDWTSDFGVDPGPLVTQTCAIGATNVDTANNLAAVLSASINDALTVASYSSGSGIVNITYTTVGLAGNSYTLADSSSGNVTASGSTLTGGVDGVARSLEFNYQDGDLLPIEASFDDYPPPAATHAIRLNTVMNVVGCFSDSVTDPTSTSPGTCIAVSKENNYESYVPTSLLYLPEQVVDVLARASDDYGFVGCQNSVSALQYIGDRGAGLPPCILTTVLPDIGVQYPQNWCQIRGQLLLYTAKGNLLLMDNQGQFDSSFANPVSKILKSFTTASTSVGYDPKNDSIVVMNGHTMLVYSFQATQWREIFLPDYGITDTLVSCTAAQQSLYFTVTDGTHETAYTYDSGSETAPLAIVSNYQNAGGVALNDIYEMAVAAETDVSTYLAATINTDLTQTVFRRISVTASIATVTNADANFQPSMNGKRFILFGDGLAILVTGGGEGNGLYMLQGTSGGKPFYNLAGAATDPTAHAIVWLLGTVWAILGTSVGNILYDSTDNVADPTLVSSWSVGVGASPAPAVIESPYLTGTIGYTSPSSAGILAIPAVSLSNCLMFIGQFAAVAPITAPTHLPNFFPNLVECRSMQFAFWLKGQNVGNVLTCDINGTTYASSRAL